MIWSRLHQQGKYWDLHRIELENKLTLVMWSLFSWVMVVTWKRETSCAIPVVEEIAPLSGIKMWWTIPSCKMPLARRRSSTNQGLISTAQTDKTLKPILIQWLLNRLLITNRSHLTRTPRIQYSGAGSNPRSCLGPSKALIWQAPLPTLTRRPTSWTSWTLTGSALTQRTWDNGYTIQIGFLQRTYNQCSLSSRRIPFKRQSQVNTLKSVSGVTHLTFRKRTPRQVRQWATIKILISSRCCRWEARR